MLTMTLFTDNEVDEIRETLSNAKENVMITFRHRFGPTELKNEWESLLLTLGIRAHCVSWWSGSSSVGLLECESSEGVSVYGQWVLADSNQLLGVFEIANEELVDIRNGYDAQSVTDPAMRAIRIGESGGELE